MSVRLATRGTLLMALTLSLALLWAALPAASGSSAPAGPAPAVTGGEFEEEAEEWTGEECESLEEWAEECEADEEGGDGTSASEECVLQSVSARVLAPPSPDTLRVVIRYRAAEPTNAYVSTRFNSAGASRSLGLVRRRLSRRGTIRLSERLSHGRMELARHARTYTVTLDVPGVPTRCRSFLTLRLSHRTTVHGKGVWTQPAARRGRLSGG